MNEDILDIFYNSIIPEATRGSIDCFMYYHICFNTSIEGHLIMKHNPFRIDTPLLEIRDKKEFNDKLCEYVKIAIEYYDDSYFYDEVLNGEYRTEKNKICKEKVLMTLLWANATVEDFKNPCQFLERQTNYLKVNCLTNQENKGYASILGGNIVTEVSKTKKLSWESPYAFRSAIFDNDEAHDLPVVRFGIDGDTVYIYSIHMRKNPRKSKRINRNLYKVNENFDISDNNEDLKDITPSSLVALDLFILHCKSLGYTNFKMVPYLPERWCDKKIMMYKKAKKELKAEEYMEEEVSRISKIQDNLTQKFITTFLRLNYHYDEGMTVSSYPMELDSYLSFICNDLSDANNPLFRELAAMYLEKNKTK